MSRKRIARCSATGCTQPPVRHGRCEAHYNRLRQEVNAKRPLPHLPPVRFGSDCAHWVGDDVSYGGAHSRVRATKGPAREFPCIDCGQPAIHWSYDHRDSDERVNAEGLKFSAKVEHYKPRCGSCHWRLDQQAREAAA